MTACVYAHAGRLRLTALIAYDYVLTISRELRGIWLRKWSGPTVVYIAIRYATLLLAVFYWVLFGEFQWHSKVRKVFHRVSLFR